MVNLLSERIAIYIKKQSPEQTASIAVMKFALEGIINSSIVLLLILAVGILSGNLWNCILSALFFMTLRFFSGGFHFSSSSLCNLVSVAAISLSVMVPISDKILLIMTIVSLLTIAAFAPSNIEKHARIPKKYFFLLKLISIFVILLNLVISNSAVGAAMFIQSLMTLPFLNRVEKEVIT